MAVTTVKWVATVVLYGCIACPLVWAQSPRSNDATDKGFRQFYADLRVAVQKRNRPSLVKLMSKDFEWNCCALGDINQDGDNRDDALQNWDNPKVHGWSALSRVLAQGTVPASGRFLIGSSKGPTRVAPPQAVRRSYRNWFATFELRSGRWYFTSFVVPEGH